MIQLARNMERFSQPSELSRDYFKIRSESNRMINKSIKTDNTISRKHTKMYRCSIYSEK